MIDERRRVTTALAGAAGWDGRAAGAGTAFAGVGLPLAVTAFAWGVLCLPWIIGAVTIPWDAKLQFYPYFRFLSDAWHGAGLPIWNPYQYAGMPWVADPQSLLFSPLLSAAAFLVPDPGVALFDTLVLAHLLIGGLALVGVFERQGWSRTGAVVAALVFMFGGVASARLQHVGLIVTYGWLPLVLLCLLLVLQRPGWRHGLLLGLAGAALLLGRDQLALMGALWLAAVGVWWLVASPAPLALLRRVAGPLALAALVTALIIAVPVALTLELVASSTRPSIDYTEAARASLSPVNLVMLFVPNYFGSLDADGLYWGPGSMDWSRVDLTDRSIDYLYIGLVPALLLVWHGLAARRAFSRDVLAFTVSLGLVLLYAFGRFTPAFALAYDWMPLVPLFRRPADANFLINLLLAVITGYLVHRLVREGPPGRPGRLGLLALGVLGAAATIVMIRVAAPYPQAEEVAGRFAVAWAGLALAAVLLAAVGRTRGMARQRAIAALLLVVVLDLRVHNVGSVMSGRDPGEYRAVVDPARDPAARALRWELFEAQSDGQGPWRAEVVGLGGVWQNAPIVLGIENTLGYNPLQLAWYAAATGAGQNSHVPKRTWTPLLPGYDSPVAAMLGVRFVATSVPVERLGRPADTAHLSLLREVGPMRLYEDAVAGPRVTAARSLAVADPDQVLRRGRWPVADPRTTVTLDRRPAWWRAIQGSTDPAVPLQELRITSYLTHEVTIDAALPEGAVVVLNDVWYPGWRVYVDGKERELLRANLIFRGVAVPAGRHEIVFRFEPFHFENLRRVVADLLP
jgi:hypothetical protein